MKNIEKSYTDPSNPGSFSGIDGFLRANKIIKRSDFLNYLKNSEASKLYTNPSEKNFIEGMLLSHRLIIRGK